MSIVAAQDTGEPETSFDRKYEAAGGATLGIGISMLVGGIVMMAMGRTKVYVD